MLQDNIPKARAATKAHLNGHARRTRGPTPLQAERITPQSLDAEQSTLGAMMMERDAIARGVEILIAEDFYRELHRKIFTVILTLFDRGEPVDLITVVEELRRRGQLEEVGGAAYLTALIESCPAAANVESYARPVKNAALNRERLTLSEILQHAIYTGNEEERDKALARIAELRADASGPKSRFTLRTLEEIEAQPPRLALIEGVLPSNSLCSLIGQYGTFKSFTAIDIALSVATGRDWHTHQVKQGPVVYITPEGTNELGKRARAWRIRHSCARPENLYFIAEAPQFMQAADVQALLRQIVVLPEPPALVVVDTVARSMVGGDENAQQDMGLLVAGADRIRETTGATLLLIHHTGANGKMRGSTVLPGALDTIIEAKKTASRGVSLLCAKQKDAADFAPIRLVGRVVELPEMDANGKPVNSLVFDECESSRGEPETSATGQKLLRILAKQFPEGARAAAWQAACEETEGIKRRTFYNYRDELEDAGQIIKEGSIYRIPQAGSSGANAPNFSANAPVRKVSANGAHTL